MLKKLMLAAAAVGSLALAAPVFAHDDHRGHRRHHFKHHYKHHHQHYHRDRPVVVMPPPRVYYAPPAPVYYAPPPVVYRPAPVYSMPEPHGQVSIRLHFPL
jgi:hypothetical protein